ncbi:TonB-dependent receptor [Roseateles sp. NT4]|uniref:TonB-dependent receptor n=1 Tax=Roseateles sp. NT4 TaxID=3453715 RepID=UPI003EE8D3E3
MIDVDSRRSLKFRSTGDQAPRMRLLPLLIAAACGAVAIGARAQNAPANAGESSAAPAPGRAASAAAAAADKTETLETVVVSVTRRREVIREVPIQVDVLSARRLEDSGATALPDYMANQAGVNVNTGLVIGNATVSIRGVGTGPETSPTVGTYIDDVSFGSSSSYGAGGVMSLDMALMDLKHIEVLRGPQGTLYGAGAMGGMLKYITNQPDTEEFSGNVRAGVSFTRKGSQSNTVGGVVNVPLSAGVAGLRVSLFRDETGGFVDSAGPLLAKDVDKRTARGGRVSLLLTPIADLSVKLSATKQDTDVAGKPLTQLDLSTKKFKFDDVTGSLAVREPSKTKVELLAAEIEYDLRWAKFASITSSQKSSLDQRFDATLTYGPLLAAAAGLTVEAVPLDTFVDVRKKTQEFRLTSQSKGDFLWLAGVFYTDETADNGQEVVATLPGGAPFPLFTSSIPSKYTEKAVYGDVTWRILPTLSATVGARLSRNNQTFTQNTSGLLAGGTTSRTNDSEETSRTYLATVSYALDPRSNVYFRAASGYRPGGPNVALPGVPDTFSHDTLVSYEAGYKADLLDKRLSLQTALYNIRWNDIQQFCVDMTLGISYICNAGKANIKGAELSANYRPDNSLELSTSLSYNNGKLTAVEAGLLKPGVPLPRLPNSARFSGSVGVTYKFNFGGNATSVGLAHRYVGERDSNFEGGLVVPNYKLPAYSLTDVQAGIALGQFQLTAYVRNLFDKRAQLGADTSPASKGGPAGLAIARPRTIGFTVSSSF